MIPFRNVLIVFFTFSTIASLAQFRLYEKGHDNYKAGKYSEAITNLTEYLTKSTRDKSIDIDVFYIRALSYYKLNNYRESIPDFEETILRGHTNKGNIYWFMAKCYDNLKDHKEALNYYNNALRDLKDKPDSKAKLLYERSQVHHRAGDLKQAYLDLVESNTVVAGNPDVRKQIEKLEKELGQSQVASLRQADIQSKPSSVANKTAANTKTTPKVEEPKPTQKKTVTETKTPKKADKSDQTTKVQPETIAVTETKSLSAPALSPLQELYKDEKRVALVIGNSVYPKKIGTLKNPLNDATDMAKELKDSHFEVTLLTNATYGQIRAALMKFKESLESGDPDKTVGLFYYAGHGLQFEDENYLVPVDAAVEYEDDIPRYCFPINRMVLSNMERSSTRMNILILDACRNNPFPSLHRSVGGAGLGEMKRGRGSFIAYATAPGSVASDGTGRNGLYTQELLKAMRKPGLTIEQVFKEVRANVLKLSGNKQNTWDSSNIVGEFHFKY